jgi:membrane-bound lytic murein transglycosylase A
MAPFPGRSLRLRRLSFGRRLLVAAAVAVAALVTLTATASSPITAAGAGELQQRAGWTTDDHAEALAALRRQCTPPALRKRRAADWLAALCGELPTGTGTGADEARAFFETWFQPAADAAGTAGFLTGYYEPEVAASRERTPAFPVPIYRRPPVLARIDPPGSVDGIPADMGYAELRPDGSHRPFHDRAAIEAGALAGRGLELAFLASAIDVFFIHIQGSARLAFADGTTARIGFDGKSGHPYTPIGRVLAEAGAIPPSDVEMATIRSWLAEHPAEAAAVMAQNRSVIFFRETGDASADPGPVGAAGVPLTPLRSLAVDHDRVRYGTPLWIDAELPLGEDGRLMPFRRLMIAQDTGSAIVGAGRGDIFIGSGAAAGAIAGRIKHRARVVPLEPRPEVLGKLGR